MTSPDKKKGRPRAEGRMLQPRKPAGLPPDAEEILTELRAYPEAQEVVLGGHLAPKHYLDYRRTNDIDAWWRRARSPAAEAAIRAAMASVAQRHRLELGERAFGEVTSFEFLTGRRKVFSFRIAPRWRYLHEPLLSPWPPLLMETLQDNIASKMNALVNRGAPRDFLDVQRVVEEGLLGIEDCWALWQRANPDDTITVGQQKVLFHLAALETRRPLESIEDPDARGRASRTRSWFRTRFLKR
jgi:hypothetical protein